MAHVWAPPRVPAAVAAGRPAVAPVPKRPLRARFSTDEGQCWYKYTFSKDPIFFTGLASEPGARSMNVSIWGFRGNFLSRKWVSYTIDFSQLLSRSCECRGGDGDTLGPRGGGGGATRGC